MLLSIFILLFSIQLFAQTELATIQAKLSAFTQSQLPEKVFLHTDKSFYTAGEIVWFKMYVMDGIFHKPLSVSKVGYVELLDKENVPVYRTKIELNEKNSGGSIQLPFGIKSGNFILRAYTNWMKNSGAANFFESKLTIVNALKSSEIADEKTPLSYRVNLFPEGGYLVNGLPSKVAFHVKDKFGKGVDATGVLVNASNDTLSSFTPNRFGMGHFELTPQNGTAYKAVFKLPDGKVISESLPSIMEQGYNMKVEEIAGDKISISVKTNLRLSYPEIYLLAQTRQLVKAVRKSVVADNTALFIIDKSSLGEGVSQFTIFDSEKRPVGERLFFIQPKKHNELRVQIAKGQYGYRDRVNLSLDSLKGGTAHLSLAVYQLDELQSGEAVTIQEYVWLTSELNGTIEDPAYYFSVSTEEVRRATDYLMLTYGWRRFKWQQVLNEAVTNKFPKERSSHIVTGKVIDTRTNSPARDIQVFLSAPNSMQKLFTAISDSTGTISFDIKDFYGAGELTLQTNPYKDSFYKVEIVSPFSEQYTNVIQPPLNLTPALQNTLQNHSISMQAQHIYLADSIAKYYKPNIIDTFSFYGMANNKYRLDDYKRFTTMEEVLREYVREVNVGIKGSNTSLRFKLLNETRREFYTDNILVMVDGIPLFNANRIFNVDPLKINNIEIIPRNYVLGSSVFQGVANFLSYDGTYKGLELEPNALTIDYEGLQMQREFYVPDYSTEAQLNNRIPDLRNTLLWVPNVSSNQISFYTGDNKGKFLVVLQGITENGQPISSTAQFEVK
jgi:hypothetical protein